MHFKTVLLDPKAVHLHSSQTCCCAFGKWPQRWLRDWSIFHDRRGWESWEQGCLAWRRDVAGDLVNVYRYLMGGSKEYGAESSQCCWVTRREAARTNRNTRISFWTRGKTPSLRGWSNAWTGHPERLCSLCPWRYSKPTWTRPGAACPCWPHSEQGIRADNLHCCLPTFTVLRFQICFHV